MSLSNTLKLDGTKIAGKIVEQKWQGFWAVIREAQQKFIPRRRKPAEGRMRHPWLTGEAKESKKVKESLQAGRVPEDWKVANETPLFKKGGRQQMGNYRPVSLTSVIGKILESY